MTPFYDYAPDDVVRPASVPLVSIMTFCQHPSTLYGTLLTFKTLRVGFPTAEVEVWDNGSRPDLVDEIRRAAEGVGARFTAMPPRHHADHLRWLLLRREAAPNRMFVLCDPDVAFFENVEAWAFGDCLIAGRLVPEHGSPGVRTRARLHPSLVFVPSLDALRSALPSEDSARWNAIGAAGMRGSGGLVGWDTLAPMTAVLEQQLFAFAPAQLDAFTHLGLGTHLAAMGMRRDSDSDVLFSAHRAAALGNLESLRGLWRAQEALYRDETAPLMRRTGSTPAEFREVLEWQGLTATDTELAEAVRRTKGRMTLLPPTNSFDPTPPHMRGA